MPDPSPSTALRACRRAARPLRSALPLTALALVAAGCGASLGGRYDHATTVPNAVSRAAGTRALCASSRRSRCRASIPAFADTRQSRALANTLCTPLVRYANAEGLPGTVIVPGLARDLPIISRGSRTFRVQLLAGLRFSDGRRLTAQDVKATFERLLDPATGSPGATLFKEIVGAKTFRSGEDPHLRGVRANGGQITFTLKRSDPAFMARLAMPIACPVASDTPHREVPDLLARQATGRYRVVERSTRPDRSRTGEDATAVPNGGTPGAAARISITRLPSAEALQSAMRSGTADLSLDDVPVSVDPPAGGAVVGARDPAHRSGALAALRRERAARALARARPRRARALRRRRRRAGPLAPARSAGSGGRPGRSRGPRARSCARAGAEGTLQLALWAEQGTQARVARAIASQLSRDRRHGRRAHRGRGSGPPARAPGSSGWPPAYGDPAAIFVPLAEALPHTKQAALTKRVRRTARLAGDARRAAFRRLDERLGGGGLGAIPLLRANFSTPISSMLVGRGTHPVFDIDLALLHTRT